jgi:hypothetical protein
MKLKINLSNQNKIFAHIFLLLVAIITILNQRQELANIFSLIFIVTSFVFLLFFLSNNGGYVIKFSFLNGCYFTLLIIVCFSSFHFIFRDDLKSFITIIYSLYPIVLFVLFFHLFAYRVITLQDVIPYMILILLLSSILVYSNALKFEEITTHQARTNWSNAVAACLPFIFLLKSKSIRLFLLVASAVILAIGLKRTGLISVFFSFILFFMFDNNKAYNAKNIVLKLMSLIIFIIMFISIFQLELFEKGITRMTNITQDGGAGRDLLLMRGWDFFIDSPLMIQIMGNGYEGFRLIAHHYSSHNDLMDFLISYGLIGCTIIIMIYCRLAYICYVFRNSEYSNFTLSVVFTFMLYSNAAGLHYYYYFFSPLFIYIAYLDGLCSESKLSSI